MSANTTVTVAVTGKLDNGQVFYNRGQEKPLTITLGCNELPPSVEAALETMNVGEARKIRVNPEEGYGARQKDLLQTIESEEMVKKLNPIPGMVLSLRAETDGVEQNIPATVIDVKGNAITVDYNHPLAGHNLTYELIMISKG